MKRKSRVVLMLVCLLLSMSLFAGCSSQDTGTVGEEYSYTAPFVGKWESDLNLIPEYAEAGRGVIITCEFSEDGVLKTYYDGQYAQTIGYFVHLDYYVAVDEGGEVESAKFAFSEDGNQLELFDLEGNSLIVYDRK